MSARPVDRGKRPWNKGLLIGQKKPLEPKHVWSMRDDVTHQMKKAGGSIFHRPLFGTAPHYSPGASKDYLRGR
jgi:hypothetical protein